MLDIKLMNTKEIIKCILLFLFMLFVAVSAKFGGMGANKIKHPAISEEGNGLLMTPGQLHSMFVPKL